MPTTLAQHQDTVMRRDAQCWTMNEPGASSTALQDVQTPAYCPIRSPVLRWLLLLAAVACLAMGIVGIFVPGLPTTVFVLMAGACAARRLAAPACLAVAPPAVWRHAAQLGGGRFCQPQGQVERQHHDGGMRSHHAAGASARLGQAVVDWLHGLRAGLAVVPARAPGTAMSPALRGKK